MCTFQVKLKDGESEERNIANALRKIVIDNMSVVLKNAERIEDYDIRLSIQASCLDVITGVEDVIQEGHLEKQEQERALLV